MQTYVQRKTEQKKKQFTVYSSVYVYIYIYIFIFKLLLCFLLFLNHYTLFYFSHVNLQLKVGANEDEVLGVRVPMAVLLPLISLNMKTWVKDMSDRSNKPLEKHRLCRHFFFFFNFLRAAGQSKRAHSVAIRDTRHMTFSFRCYC